MAMTGSGYEILGVTVCGGPLEEPVHIALDAGLTALYGVNGVGKSWILRLLSSGLTGVAPEVPDHAPWQTADLHIRVVTPEGPVEGPFLNNAVERLIAAVQARRGEYLQTQLEDDVLAAYRHELGERSIARSVWDIVAMLIDLSPATHQTPLEITHPMYEGAYGGFLTLRATGTAQRPSWNIMLSQSATVGEKFPTFLRAARQAWRELMTLADPTQIETSGGSDRFHRFADTWRERNRLYWSDEATRYLKPNGPLESWDHAAGDPWPDWMQVPVLSLAENLTVPPLQVLGGASGPREVDEETLFSLLGARPVQKTQAGRTAPGAAIVGIGEDGPLFVPPVAMALDEIQRAAQANLADVLVDPPQLRFDVSSVEAWFEGRRPRWEFLEGRTERWMPVNALSSAQERWARLAVGLASARRDGTPVVFVCDEPEAGLHRLAERHLAKGLHTLSKRTGVSVIVATHSPRLLDANDMHPILVHRDTGGATKLAPVTLSLVDRSSADLAAQQHGLTVGDLTALMRLTVVVEGIHDEFVFAALLREELDGALAGILPMHGGKHARSLADARLLFDGTDAQILLVLDNLEQEEVNDVWARTASLAAEGRTEDARTSLEALDRGRSSERLFLHQFGIRALEVGRMDRIHIHGLSMPDVICYLPPSLLLQKSGTWPDLLVRWSREAAPAAPQNLKGWLKRNHYLPKDNKAVDDLIEDAAFEARRMAAPVHPDLVDLGLHIQQLSLHDS